MSLTAILWRMFPRLMERREEQAERDWRQAERAVNADFARWRPGVHHGLHMRVKDGKIHYRAKSSIREPL